MLPIACSKMRANTLLLGLVAVAVVVVLWVGLTGFERARMHSNLQEIANEAALAAVMSLRDSIGQSDAQRADAAVAASRAVTDRIRDAQASVSASIAPVAVSVALSERKTGLLGRINGIIDVVGKAAYLPPSSDGSQVPLHNRLNWKILTARSG